MLGMNAHALGIRHDLILGEGNTFMQEVERGIRQYLEHTGDARKVPLVNLQCDLDHPTQALADALWLQERFPDGLQGRKIVFGNTENENQNLYIMDIESQTVEQLTHHAGFNVAHPGWSPDGASIVYVSNRGGKAELWIYDLASRTESVIESGARDMNYPVWSPDGQWIAFDANKDGDEEIYAVSLKGGHPMPSSRSVSVLPGRSLRSGAP